MNNSKYKTLGTKIILAMMALVLMTILVVSVIIVLRMNSVQEVIVDYNGKLGDEAGEISSSSMEEEVTEHLLQIAMSQLGGMVF